MTNQTEFPLVYYKKGKTVSNMWNMRIIFVKIDKRSSQIYAKIHEIIRSPGSFRENLSPVLTPVMKPCLWFSSTHDTGNLSNINPAACELNMKKLPSLEIFFIIYRRCQLHW